MFLDYQSQAMQDINNRISRLATHGQPQEEFIFANIQEFEESENRKQMLVAQRYYANENDILERKRYYIDRRGSRKELNALSNSRLAHPFMRKLTNQKVNYLLSKELTIQCDNNEIFSEHLSSYIDKKFLRALKRVGRDAIVNGIAWVQVYYDEQGNLQFKRIPSEEVIPFWADADHTELEAVIRYYTITHYKERGEKEEITKVEYHTTEGVWYYIKGSRGLIPDPDKGEQAKGHFVVATEAKDTEGNVLLDEQGNPIKQEIQATWEKVPFIAFKYNPDEYSLLRWIKTLIDDYDTNTSDTSNNLQDVPNSIKIVKNYAGSDKEEFSQNLTTFRTVFVEGDGDVKALETRLDITTIDSHLDRVRKDIYEAGCGVDTQETNLGNASGVALKFRYADLDSDTDDMASEFAASLEELIWFVKVDLLNKGMGDFTDVTLDIIFNTDNIMNEHEIILGAKESLGIISEETIVANHPWVTDMRMELDRLKAEQEQRMTLMPDMYAGLEYGQENDDEGEGESNNSGGDE